MLRIMVTNPHIVAQTILQHPDVVEEVKVCVGCNNDDGNKLHKPDFCVCNCCKELPEMNLVSF